MHANAMPKTATMPRSKSQSTLFLYFMLVALFATMISVAQIHVSSRFIRNANTDGNDPQGLQLVPGLKVWKSEAIDRFKRKHPKIEDQDVMPVQSQPVPQDLHGSNDDEEEEIETDQELDTRHDKGDIDEIQEGVMPNSGTEKEHSTVKQSDTAIKIAPRRPKATIVYAIAVTECPNDMHVLNGASVLAESIKNMSFRRNVNSTYEYSLYAFVHDDARACNAPLYSLGYTVLNGKSPLDEVDKEYIKIYALSLSNHKIVVTLEVDTLLLQPLDELFDFMLEGTVSTDLAQSQNFDPNINPDRIHFVSTKTADRLVDHSFFIARTSKDAYPKALEQMKAHPGKSFDDFLNHVYGKDHLELDNCVYNTYISAAAGANLEDAKDNGVLPCDNVPFEKIKFAHFSSCGVPWKCKDMTEERAVCQKLHREWHRNRQLLDEALKNALPHPDGGLANTFGYCKRIGEFKPIKIAIINQEDV